MKFLFVFILVSLLKDAAAQEAVCYAGIDYPDCKSCGGACASGNGCYCSDYITQCFSSTCSIAPHECCPVGLFWYSEKKCCTESLVCTPQCLSDESCGKISDIATCVCNTTAYQNMTIKDLKTTVTCDGDAMTVSVSKCLLEFLHYDHTSIQLKNDPNFNCSAGYFTTLNDQTVQALQVKATAGLCGNRVTYDLFKVNYTNTLYIGIKNETLIVVNPIEMDFTCSYNLTMQTALNVTLNPVTSTTFLNATNGEGSYPLTLAAYKNSAYNDPFSNGENVDVGSPIYLGFFIAGADGDKFVLRVVSCFGTPDTRDNPNRVQLLSGGCPIDGGDVDAALVQNGVSLEALFRINAFAFDGLPSVSIFCEARLCDNKTENCSACDSGRANEPNTGEVSVTLTMNERIDFSSSGTPPVPSALLAGSLLLLLFNKLF
ncbi:uromodulin-like [Discoglossus pictus]